MDHDFSIKRLFIRLLIAFPLIYTGFGWFIGLNYGTKPLQFGPFEDSSSGGVSAEKSADRYETGHILSEDELKTLKRVIEDKANPDQSLTTAASYFTYPQQENYSFPDDLNIRWFKGLLKKKLKLKTTFTAVKSYCEASAWDKGSNHIGDLRSNELYDFLKQRIDETATKKENLFKLPGVLEEKFPWLFASSDEKPSSKLDSYWLLRALEENFPWAYGQGNELLFYPHAQHDLIGIIGIILLILIAKSMIGPGYWLYYLFCVAANFLGSFGFYSANAIFKNDIDRVILWSFLTNYLFCHPFLLVTVFVSVPVFLHWGFIYFTKHYLPRQKRRMEDFFKIDKDIDKRKELSIEDVEFKTIHYDINRKLAQYAKIDKYFLAVSDDKKDILVDEDMLNHHLHVLGPTGSGKTSLVILPLSRQAIEKGRGCCFIDFKGDEVFKRYVQQKAREKGKRFYYFSIDPKEQSVSYNPLSSGDIHSKVDRIMTALELIYQGPAGFYSNVQSMAFIELLKEIIQDKKEINFSTVKDSLENPHFLRRIDVNKQDVKGLLAVISWMSGQEVINRDELNLSEAINNGDIVFFALKSQMNTRLAEAIGRMLVIDLKLQAASRTEANTPYFIFIDEFQNLACSHFVDVISKVRSANFCLVLSNQSRGNLTNLSAAFENVIFTNTATKVIFMQEDPWDAKFWSEKTGQTTYQDKTILQVDTLNKDNKGVKFDGLRSSQGNIHTARKNYIESNVFLRLPFAKSVIFLREKLTVIANHEFLFDKKERDRIVLMPFEYKH